MGVDKIICIISGRYQPFGDHHYQLYQWAANKFGTNNTYIGTSNVTGPQSPFNFDEKKNIISYYGLKNKVKYISSPYIAHEITDKFNSNSTAVVFIIGGKDADRISKGKGFLIPYPKDKNLNPYSKNTYYIIAPIIKKITHTLSASDFRKTIQDPKLSKTDKIAVCKEYFQLDNNELFNFVIDKLSKTNEDIIPGGKGDSLSEKDVDPKELKMGIKVELEHTKNSNLAKEIALDHLAEDPKYYTKLKKTGLADELDEHLFSKSWWKQLIQENLVDHAERELKLAGLLEADSDYNGALGKAVLELIELFSKQGHSGFSATLVRELFNRCSNFENLTPITSNEEEWEDMSNYGGDPLWQSKRNPTYFSKDKGKTWYNLNESILFKALLTEVYRMPNTFKELFLTAPIELQNRIKGLYKIPQNPKHHPEGNVLKHTILVVNRALRSKDIDIAIAALLHDVGKDVTLVSHPVTGLPTAYGHEDESAKLVKQYLDWIKKLGGNPANIRYIIKNHMRVKGFNDMRPVKQKKLSSFRAYNKLNQFTNYDKGGLQENLFTTEWWSEALIKSLILEGGAAGHMIHPYELPEIKTGDDLVKLFEKATNSIKLGRTSLKIDGVNASLRLVTLDNKKQFVLDRGSNAVLDVIGVTKSFLTKRFPEGHGFIKIGNSLLTIFNKAIPSIKDELIKLGLWENPNILLNIEYVDNQINTISYKGKYIFIHGLMEIYRVSDTKRISRVIPTNAQALSNLISKLNDIQNEYYLYSSAEIKITFSRTPNFRSILKTPITLNLEKGKQEKSLSEWLTMIKTIDSKSMPLRDFLDISNNKRLIQIKEIRPYITKYSVMLLGDELLKSLSSEMGNVESHEGIVINDPSNFSKIFKITGSFTTKNAVSTKFKSKITEGGNVFKQNSVHLTDRIKKDEILPTIKWLEAKLKISVLPHLVGSSLSKPDSGDLDILMSNIDISKSELVDKLKTMFNSVSKSPDNRIKVMGNNVHIRIPIIGSNREVQVDFMFGIPKDMSWVYINDSKSKYYSKHRLILINSIAKYHNLKFADVYGLITRDTGKLLARKADDVAKILLGPEAIGKDLYSVESIMRQISKYKERDAMIKEAKETLKSKYGINLEF